MIHTRSLLDEQTIIQTLMIIAASCFLPMQIAHPPEGGLVIDVLVRSTSRAMTEARLLPPRDMAGELEVTSTKVGEATDNDVIGF